PGEVDTAVTRLQCRDLQGRFIEATWTCATRQQKSDKQKGQRPDFRPHYAPSRYRKAPSYKSTANNERLAIASLFPRPTSSVYAYTLRLRHVFRSTRSARPREQIALDVD